MTQSTLIEETIPSIVGGVSQQAPQLRRQDQVELQENCRNSLVDGCGKRPNSESRGWVTLDTSNTINPERAATLAKPDFYHIQDIDRGANEYYKVLVTDAELKVLDGFTAAEYPVVWSHPFVRFYLVRRNDRDYRDSYQVQSVLDRTWILNKTVPVEHLPAEPERFMADETDERDVYIHTTQSPYMYQGIRPSKNNLEHYYEYLIEGVQRTITVTSNTGHEDVVYWLAEQIRDITGWAVSQTSSTGGIIKVTVPANQTLELEGKWVYSNYRNDNNIYETGDAVLKATEQLTTPLAANTSIPQALYFIKQGDRQQKYTVVLEGFTCQYETPALTGDGDNFNEWTTKWIVGNMVSQINSKNADHGCSASAVGNTILIQKDDGSDFTISYEDSMGSTASGLVKGAVEGIADLPAEAPEGYPVEVAGDLDLDADPFWVKYTALDDDGNDASGRWVESLPPGTATDLHIGTMPIFMDRKQDDQYISETNPRGIYFFVNFEEWSTRQVGSTDTAPWPSFVSEMSEDNEVVTARYIDGLFFHENRMCMLSGNHFVASEAGEYTNFFPTTVSAVVDSDPIDVEIETTDGAPLVHQISATNELLLFTRHSVEALRYDGALSLNTVRADTVSAHAVSPQCKPIAVDNQVLFVSSGSRFSQLNTLYVDGQAETYTSERLTLHVPVYIEGTVLKVEHSPVGDYIFMLTREAEGVLPNHIYVCNTKTRGRERIQNAWQKWTFGGKVLDMHVKNGVLFLMVRYGPDWTKLESIDLENDYVYDEFEHPIFLDSREEIEETDDALVYQWKVEAKDVDGNVRYFRGHPYTQKMELSPLYARMGPQNRPALSGRTTVGKVRLNYHRTTGFKVTVLRGAQKRVTEFYARIVGSLSNLIGKIPVETGSLPVGVQSRNDNVTISIENQSEFDAVIQTIDWEGRHTTRATRV